MSNYSWTCPFCNQPVTITPNNEWDMELYLKDSNCKDGYKYTESKFIVCPNPKCRKFTLIVELKIYKM